MPETDAPPEIPRKMIGIDAAPGQEATIVTGWRDADGVIHIEQMTVEDRARTIAAFSEIGRNIREAWEGAARQLAAALQPTLDAIVALHHAFEAAGLYDLDPDQIRIGLLEDDADDYADTYRDTPDPPWAAGWCTCGHVCGPDPDHECQAAATTALKHRNLAGGVTQMPICGPCYESETAAKEHVDA